MRLVGPGHLEWAAAYDVDGKRVYQRVPYWGASIGLEENYGVRGPDGVRRLRIRGGSIRDNVGEFFAGRDHLRRPIWEPIILAGYDWRDVPGAMRRMTEAQVAALPNERKYWFTEPTFLGPFDDNEEDQREEIPEIVEWLEAMDGTLTVPMQHRRPYLDLKLTNPLEFDPAGERDAA